MTHAPPPVWLLLAAGIGLLLAAWVAWRLSKFILKYTLITLLLLGAAGAAWYYFSLRH